MPRPKQVSWRRVNSPRNSECGSARLQDLDWSNWWTDTSAGQHYLHVAHRDGETFHRVYCRLGGPARIGMRNGLLYWLLDPPQETP
jgi:hypothetical protein